MEEKSNALKTHRLLRSNSWSLKVMWTMTAIMLLFAFSGIAEGLFGGERTLQGGIFFLIWGLFFARLSMLGVVLKNGGLVLRTYFWTYQLTWHDIDRFELRDTVYTPSLKIVLGNGKCLNAVGLAARSAGEKARAREICEGLNERLAAEHQKRSMHPARATL